ncbi:hypothetical protein C8Q74DRAFT_816241 [Fomes fomentarius]|nr:hypothetical protein C8Q74DRAFT_816241 [Fomes fomentarius]
MAESRSNSSLTHHSVAVPFAPPRTHTVSARDDASSGPSQPTSPSIQRPATYEDPDRSTQRSSSITSSTSSDRRSRPVPDFHADTYIPPSTTFAKPTAPRRDPRDTSLFTDDDKIFFIHFLRWRLQSGDVPARSVLEWELAQAAPHHSERSWKKHWDANPSLPDDIYIAACKRAENEARMYESSHPWQSTGAHPGDSAEDEGGASAHYSNTPRMVCKSSSRRGKCSVTEEDLREMSLFMFEKRHVWHEFKSPHDAWVTFGNRPKNRERRSTSAWYSVARQHKDKIMKYYGELMHASGTRALAREEPQQRAFPHPNRRDIVPSPY